MSNKLPEGFRDLSGGGEEWQPVIGESIQGVVRRIKMIPKGTGSVKVDTRVMLLDTQKGAMQVWESAMLGDLFDEAKEGDVVFIRFDETKQNKTDNPTKMFTVGLKKL